MMHGGRPQQIGMPMVGPMAMNSMLNNAARPMIRPGMPMMNNQMAIQGGVSGMNPNIRPPNMMNLQQQFALQQRLANNGNMNFTPEQIQQMMVRRAQSMSKFYH
jgi:hypothetical protein